MVNRPLNGERLVAAYRNTAITGIFHACDEIRAQAEIPDDSNFTKIFEAFESLLNQICTANPTRF